MTASATDTVNSFFQALGSGDMAAAMALLAADCRWTYHGPDGVIPWAGTFTGPDGVGQFFARFGEHAEPVEMAPQSMEAAGATVFVRGIETSRVKATGKTYSVPWIHAIAVADGRIASFDEYIDSAAVAAAMA
ncbi:nuclear transport factor 2 family protein [Sphingomonas flavalba]|uniref:nuclear transport factor 2 family protein n=1 Tax=Sphingomonas flavalba TaxID=2559804 RepID=UPI00109DBABE|nr:nuclear transport factor 2 family protein [Sphingomonas flavalba]